MNSLVQKNQETKAIVKNCNLEQDYNSREVKDYNYYNRDVPGFSGGNVNEKGIEFNKNELDYNNLLKKKTTQDILLSESNLNINPNLKTLSNGKISTIRIRSSKNQAIKDKDIAKYNENGEKSKNFIADKKIIDLAKLKNVGFLSTDNYQKFKNEQVKAIKLKNFNNNWLIG